MSLDISTLVNVRRRGDKIIARCDACAEQGGDKAGDHLVVYPDGRFGCVAHAGDPQHRARILELAGSDQPTPPQPLVRRSVTRPSKPDLPKLEQPSIAEMDCLARQRGLPGFAALELAHRAGQFWMCNLRDGPEPVRAWLITDSSRRNAQARRLDGKLWQSMDKPAKAKTVYGSQAAWPIGAADIGSKPIVALCEGAPDMLSAWFLSWWHRRCDQVAPVAMVGAGMRIHDEALPYFIGKKVYIFPHSDAAGQQACERWMKQVRQAGAASVGPYHLGVHKDLNELITACAKAMEDEQ